LIFNLPPETNREQHIPAENIGLRPLSSQPMEKILIIDFGSQYTQLIARRVRELNIYCEIHPFQHYPEPDEETKGVILSGSPFSVHDADAPHIALEQLLNKVPVLGVCYGAQLMAQTLGGKVEKSNKREYGRAILQHQESEDVLFEDVGRETQVWMSHGDTISQLPAHFEKIAHTDSIPVAAFRSKGGSTPFPVYCIQFHPEVTHTLEGKRILQNFCVTLCGCSQSWTPGAFASSAIATLQEKLGRDQVILALSGGVDSSVAAALLHHAVGKNLFCFFINNGLLRKEEYAKVLKAYEQMGLNVEGVDASQRFYEALRGVSDPETKRKIIGRLFIELFEEEAHKKEGIQWLAQGTIYPDVIESVSVHGPSQTIKSHHNVGGLPEKMKMKIVEPLRMLFKDEVRRVGREMQVPQEILQRHPFPGPGLAIRIIGDITEEKVRILQEADDIFISGLRQHGLYDQVWQAGAILTSVQSVGVMGDERTYEKVVALRAVESVDGMTADWCRLPYEFLAEVSNRIINQVKGINRVVYDISSKPPATIEWE